MGINVDKYFRLFLVALMVMPFLAYSAPNNATPRTRALKRDIQSIKQILSQNKLEKNTLNAEVADVEYQVAAAKRVIVIIEGAEKVSTYELAKLRNQLEVIEREHEMALSQYQVILVEEYKNRDYRTKLYFLASSNSFSEFITRLNYLEKLKEFRKRQLTAIENKKKEVGDKLSVYSGSSQEKSRISKMKIEEVNRLNTLLNEKYQVLQKLETSENNLQLQLNAAQAQLNEFSGTKENGGAKTSIESTISISKMIWPLKNGLVVSHFGIHKHSKERKIQVENNGIDILVSTNEPVRCVADGEVKAVLQIPGSNTTLIIDHKTHYSVYSNLDGTTLSVGNKVNKEDVLGNVAKDNQGASKLHFEVWQGTKKLNPEDYLLGKLN